MKKLLFLSTLIFTVMFSSTSFADWTKVLKGVEGNTCYVDFYRIRKHGGYVYWWELVEYLKPNKYGSLSGKIYIDKVTVNYFGLSILVFPITKNRWGGELVNLTINQIKNGDILLLTHQLNLF